MTADFRFHPVGHGLFYSGVVETRERSGEPFTFVYDCGGKDPVGQFKEFWDPFKKEHEDIRLTLLVVSHFHKDHISGIPYLIKVAKPKFAVMPYLSPVERVACFAVLSKESDLDQMLIEDLGRLILAPEACCKEHGCKLYLINPDEQVEKQPEGFDELSVARASDELSFPDENPTRENGAEVIRNGAVGFFAGWRFHFFMPKKATNSQEIENWLFSKTIRDQGELNGRIDNALFEEITKKFGDLKLKNNGSNLVCVHGPVRNVRKDCVCVLAGDWVGYSSRFCVRRRGWHAECVMPTCLSARQMLTGDAEFNEVSNFSKWMSDDECNQVALFQVPHHGSPLNREDWFESQLPNCIAWVVPHGFGTRDVKNKFKIYGTSGGWVYYIRRGLDVYLSSSI